MIYQHEASNKGALHVLKEQTQGRFSAANLA
ncbi:hypothetical protein HCH_05204 [Hahella chejuensis KCTC 2396]|uniref:Uncharacterized protein n=1 Tax=Hahella chejuensis (strain KCTC 2396) TaxID=349521 RepID=Q2SBU3_HAHCH|nr:hypothetical protein HCH_05204 [Hahella chejuensis KCTC 2396]